MPVEERRRRWRTLMEGVERDDVVAWRDSFVASLEEAREGGKTRRTRVAGVRPKG
jgi:trehalose 6-phosphate synthase